MIVIKLDRAALLLSVFNCFVGVGSALACFEKKAGACDLAKALGETEALKTLSETLSEEVATDAKLAKAFVPAVAAASASEE